MARTRIVRGRTDGQRYFIRDSNSLVPKRVHYIWTRMNTSIAVLNNNMLKQKIYKNV